MFKASNAVLTAICASSVLCLAASAFAQDSHVQNDSAKRHAFVIQDNSYRYTYSNWFRDPYTDQAGDASKASNVPKNGLGFSHMDIGNKLGDNFFDMQYWSSKSL